MSLNLRLTTTLKLYEQEEPAVPNSDTHVLKTGAILLLECRPLGPFWN